MCGKDIWFDNDVDDKTKKSTRFVDKYIYVKIIIKVYLRYEYVKYYLLMKSRFVVIRCS